MLHTNRRDKLGWMRHRDQVIKNMPRAFGCASVHWVTRAWLVGLGTAGVYSERLIAATPRSRNLAAATDSQPPCRQSRPVTSVVRQEPATSCRLPAERAIFNRPALTESTVPFGDNGDQRRPGVFGADSDASTPQARLSQERRPAGLEQANCRLDASLATEAQVAQRQHQADNATIQNYQRHRASVKPPPAAAVRDRTSGQAKVTSDCTASSGLCLPFPGQGAGH